jgi:hypothetical protein
MSAVGEDARARRDAKQESKRLLTALLVRSRANSAHIRQSRPDHCLDFQLKVHKTCQFVPSLLESCRGGGAARRGARKPAPSHRPRQNGEGSCNDRTRLSGGVFRSGEGAGEGTGLGGGGRRAASGGVSFWVPHGRLRSLT